MFVQGLVTLVAIWPPTIAVDFFQEWSSAREVLAGQPAYPKLREAVPRLLGTTLDLGPETVLVNAHPPVSILLGLPFAYFSYPAAVELWRLLSFGLILAGIEVIGRALEPMPYALTPPVAVMAILLLTSGPVALTIFQGQLNGVLLALIVGAWWSDRRGHERLSGALLGLAGAIKVSPLLLLGYFVIRGRWRAVTAGLLAFLAANILTAVILGPGVFREYFAVLPQVSKHRSGRTNAALAGLCAKLFDPAPGSPIEPLWRSPELYRLATLGSVAAVAALAALAIRRARCRREQDRAFGLSITAFLLIGPLTWEHTLLLLMLPLGLLARDWPARSRGWRVLFLIVVVAVWLMPYTAYDGLALHDEPVGPLLTVAALSYQCYALLLVFALSMSSRGGRVELHTQ
jgi:hypothetical protein